MSQDWVIIDGSHRNGNTTLINTLIAQQLQANQLILRDYQINHYVYESIDKSDDFITVINTILKYQNIILTTPMYWYAMSGRMKVFLDRFTELLKNYKNLGRQLRGKTLTLIYNSNGVSQNYFELPFENTANYLGMKYLGALHINMEMDSLSKINKDEILAFLSGINQINN